MSYWDLRFRREGKIWGDKPSETAIYAAEVFRSHGISSVLVEGSGYGRNAEALAQRGLTVSGLELSSFAHQMATQSSKQKGLAIAYSLGDLLSMPYGDAAFEGVYCFNVLHLFLEKDRKRLIGETRRVLKLGGLAVFTVFSEKDSSFGVGDEVEPNTFESRRDRPAHYFTEDDLNSHFSTFKILENRLVAEEENHDPGPHTHMLRLIAAQE